MISVLSYNSANLSKLSFLNWVPRGDGPLPEVGAILGQPVRKTKQALYIPRSTKIEEQLVPEGTYQLLH